MSGTVVICADEAGRFSLFAASIQRLRLPEGAETLWLFGNDFASNRNVGCRHVIENGGEWVFFIDDDHCFSPFILEQLVESGEDIIGALCLMRQQPFFPTCQVDGQPVDLSLYPADGVIEVERTGSSGLLIRRGVLEAVGDPWFQHRDGVSEDYVFCEKAHENGFDITVDLASRLGHITTCAVWPSWDGVKWETGLTVADGAKLTIPSAEREAV